MKLELVAPAPNLDPAAAPTTQPLLADVWTWVRKGVQAVIDSQGMTLLPEDVYVALKTAQASLWLIGDVGFVIGQRHIDSDGSAVFFIWILHTEPDAMRECWREVSDELDRLARMARCTKQRMYSNRAAWRRLGWDAKAFLYEKGVS